VSVICADASLMAHGDMALYIKNVEDRGIFGNATVERAKRRLVNNSYRLFHLDDPTIVSPSLHKTFLLQLKNDFFLSRGMLLAAVSASTFQNTLTALGFLPTAQSVFSNWERGVSNQREGLLDLSVDASVDLTKGRIDVRAARRSIVMKKPGDPNYYCFTLVVMAPRPSPASSSSSSAAAAERPLTLAERVCELEPRYSTPTSMTSALNAPVPFSPPK
jgi:hypothetical protein